MPATPLAKVSPTSGPGPPARAAKGQIGARCAQSPRRLPPRGPARINKLRPHDRNARQPSAEVSAPARRAEPDSAPAREEPRHAFLNACAAEPRHAFLNATPWETDGANRLRNIVLRAGTPAAGGLWSGTRDRYVPDNAHNSCTGRLHRAGRTIPIYSATHQPTGPRRHDNATSKARPIQRARAHQHIRHATPRHATKTADTSNGAPSSTSRLLPAIAPHPTCHQQLPQGTPPSPATPPPTPPPAAPLPNPRP